MFRQYLAQNAHLWTSVWTSALPPGEPQCPSNAASTTHNSCRSIAKWLPMHSVNQSTFIGHLLCACTVLSTKDQVMIPLCPYSSTPVNNFTGSTIETSFPVMPPQWGRCLGAAAQPIPRWTPAPSSLLLPSQPTTKITTLLDSLTALYCMKDQI